MLTTAGDNFSTKPAKLSGTANKGLEKKMILTNRNFNLILFIVVFESEINKA
jgi:hypothetical protein